MDLEKTLNEVVELARAELAIVRKRGEEKTPAGEHSHDYMKARDDADRLDRYTHELRQLHDEAYGSRWRKESAL